MKITFMTLQKASIVCLGVGMFLVAAGLLMRLSFALQDYEEKQRKIHKAQRGTVKKPSTKRKAG